MKKSKKLKIATMAAHAGAATTGTFAWLVANSQAAVADMKISVKTGGTFLIIKKNSFDSGNKSVSFTGTDKSLFRCAIEEGAVDLSKFTSGYTAAGTSRLDGTENKDNHASLVAFDDYV